MHYKSKKRHAHAGGCITNTGNMQEQSGTRMKMQEKARIISEKNDETS